MKGAFRAVWRNLFPKQAKKPETKTRVMKDPDVKVADTSKRRPVNRADCRRRASLEYRTRDSADHRNQLRCTMKKRSKNRRRNKIAKASRRANRQ